MYNIIDIIMKKKVTFNNIVEIKYYNKKEPIIKNNKINVIATTHKRRNYIIIIGILIISLIIFSLLL